MRKTLILLSMTATMFAFQSCNKNSGVVDTTSTKKTVKKTRVMEEKHYGLNVIGGKPRLFSFSGNLNGVPTYNPINGSNGNNSITDGTGNPLPEVTGIAFDPTPGTPNIICLSRPNSSQDWELWRIDYDFGIQSLNPNNAQQINIIQGSSNISLSDIDYNEVNNRYYAIQINGQDRKVVEIDISAGQIIQNSATQTIPVAGITGFGKVDGLSIGQFGRIYFSSHRNSGHSMVCLVDENTLNPLWSAHTEARYTTNSTIAPYGTTVETACCWDGLSNEFKIGSNFVGANTAFVRPFNFMGILTPIWVNDGLGFIDFARNPGI